LLLYRFGGSWIDMDIALLNSFSPVFGLEYLYAWGVDLNFGSISEGPCGSVMALNKKSELGHTFLELAKSIFPVAGSTCYGRDLFAKAYKIKPYTVFPTGFFNIEWCMNSTSKGLGDLVESQWFEDPLADQEHLCLGSFAWHWHNSSKKNLRIAPHSKFAHLWNYSVLNSLRCGHVCSEYLPSDIYV
jgi:hypothetical protein